MSEYFDFFLSANEEKRIFNCLDFNKVWSYYFVFDLKHQMNLNILSKLNFYLVTDFPFGWIT